MTERGVYGRPHRGRPGAPSVGGTLYHTIGDREEALASLKRDVNALYQELTRQILHATPEHPFGLASDATIRPDWFAWWKSRGNPFFNDFRDWVAERSPANWSRFGAYVAFGKHFETDWDAYKAWGDRLVDLRREAEGLGIKLKSSDPVALPTTLVEDVEDIGKKLAKKVEGVGDYLKYVVVAAVGVAVIAALSGVVRDVRAGEAPTERYLSLLRRREV